MRTTYTYQTSKQVAKSFLEEEEMTDIFTKKKPYSMTLTPLMPI